MKRSFFKPTGVVGLQWVGALLAFILSLMVANIVLPFPSFIMEKIPAVGFLPNGWAMLFSGAMNATILVWAARRASSKD